MESYSFLKIKGLTERVSHIRVRLVSILMISLVLRMMIVVSM